MKELNIWWYNFLPYCIAHGVALVLVYSIKNNMQQYANVRQF